MPGILRHSAAALALIVAWSSPASGQIDLDQVDSLIGEIRLDSLTSYVGSLSGITPISVTDSVLLYLGPTTALDSVWLEDTLVTLTHRWHVSNDVATDYIERKLNSFGLDTVFVVQRGDMRWTRSVIGMIYGSEYPDRHYIMCAHYDGVGSPAPAADDNASGTAAVLEAARVVANMDVKSTVVFALFDSEEVGLFGAKAYAQSAFESGQDIGAVINLDMIGWDGDDDHVVEFHTNVPSSFVANDLVRTITEHNLDLQPTIQYPGTQGSDHAAFWQKDYPANLIIEEYYGGDFNPRYHSPGDSLQYFNMAFFHEVAKLGLATITRYALGVSPIVHVDSKVLLNGAYVGSDTMGVGASFVASRPLSQPYSNPLFNGTPLDHDSTTAVNSFPESTIDWILASLRSDTAYTSEISGSRRAALLLHDGSVVDTNGLMLAFPGVPPGPYHLVLRHRNHASVMSSDTLSLSDGLGSWDFRKSIDQAFTTGPLPMKNLGDGNYAMYGGDGSVDGQITVTDFNQWLVDTKSLETGYRQTDFGLDGQVTVTDFNLWLQNTKAAAASQVPDP